MRDEMRYLTRGEGKERCPLKLVSKHRAQQYEALSVLLDL